MAWSYHPDNVTGACISSSEVRVEGVELKLGHRAEESDDEISFVRQKGGIM